MVIRFLSLAKLLLIHQDQITRYGGEAGMRDVNLLKSALAMPPAAFGGHHLHTDIYEMAAAYLYHVVQNQPFFDGNKRTGAVAAIVFLALNGHEFGAAPGMLHEFVMALARGERSKAEAALFIREHSQERQG